MKLHQNKRSFAGADVTVDDWAVLDMNSDIVLVPIPV